MKKERHHLWKNIMIMAAVFLVASGSSIILQKTGVHEHITAIFIFAVFLTSILTDGYIYGIVSALVLASLGVDEDIIMEDYRLSNDYFNIPAASRYAYQLPARSQEAITTLFSAREDFLNAAIEEMERRYGDTDTYLQRGIGLTKEERKRLQDILLTDN